MIKLKIIRNTIIIILIAIIGLLIMLKVLRKNTKDFYEQDFEAAIYDDVEKITNKTTFFTIDKCINKYFIYKLNGNDEAIKEMSADEIITKEYSYDSRFYSKEMYSIDKVSNITAFVYGVILEKDIEEDYYIIINLDYDNNTFNLKRSSKEEYMRAQQNYIEDIYKKKIYINKNQYNELNLITISDFEIINKYFEYYKYKSLYNQEEAFNLLDSQYKEKKFDNNIDNYKLYISKNINKIKDAYVAGYSVINNGLYGEYIAVDNYDNYYTITETDIGKYNIMLDNYTIETDEFLEKYKKLSDKEKVASVLDKIMKLINEQNYTELYKHLNEEFKSKNLKTQEDFEKYIKERFFENNIIGKTTYSVNNNIFTVTVSYKESVSRAAEIKETTFIIKLGEGTNFELSFATE